MYDSRLMSPKKFRHLKLIRDSSLYFRLRCRWCRVWKKKTKKMYVIWFPQLIRFKRKKNATQTTKCKERKRIRREKKTKRTKRFHKKNTKRVKNPPENLFKWWLILSEFDFILLFYLFFSLEKRYIVWNVNRLKIVIRTKKYVKRRRDKKSFFLSLVFFEN